MVWKRKTKIKEIPRGIMIKKNKKSETIQISFMYKGIRCRELLKNLPVTTSNINYASRKLAEIINNIERDSFNYADYFPYSNKLSVFGSASRDSTIKDYLLKYLNLCEKRNLSPSTIKGYKKCLNALDMLHNVYVAKITPALVKNWIEQQTSSLKTVRNNYSFLKSSLDDAIIDGLLVNNPATAISVSRYYKKNNVGNKKYIVEPFSNDEVLKILDNCGNEQWENLIKFSFFTGMRPSEICAAKWSNVNFINKTYYVNTASVVGVEKGTKTNAGTRTIELDDKAMAALNKQKKYTSMKSSYIFQDPKTRKPWAGADAIRKKVWVPTLKKAGINYRNPYQMRHTFATRHTSKGANLFWLSSQMGHKGPEMLFRNYGKYLKSYEGNTSIQKSSNH